MKTEPKIGIVLLAAGASSRMKQNKMMIPIDGISLLEHTIRAAVLSKATENVVVTGANKDENAACILGFDVCEVYNTDWDKGIGGSIKKGLGYLVDKNKNLNAIIISVCDQPFLSNEVFDGLIETYTKSGKKIVAAEYAESIGVPVLYDHSFFTELAKIPDRYGAKKFIIEKVDDDIITTFPFPKGEIDIDSIDDIKKLSLL